MKLFFSLILLFATTAQAAPRHVTCQSLDHSTVLRIEGIRRARDGVFNSVAKLSVIRLDGNAQNYGPMSMIGFLQKAPARDGGQAISLQLMERVNWHHQLLIDFEDTENSLFFLGSRKMKVVCF